MIITPVDEQNNLFSVENVYSDELIAEIRKLNLMTYPYEKVNWQEHMPRRKLQFSDTDILARINVENTANIAKISEAIGIAIKDVDTAIWVDYNQFSMGIHEDNPLVDIAMQVYLFPNVSNIGTKFYHTLQQSTLRYDFPYTVNTGYIMVNAPGQFHGATRSTPMGTMRCSSYSYFSRLKNTE